MNDQPLASHADTTASYDALMRLATLDECVQDAIAARARIARDIDKLISENKDGYSASDELSQSKDHLDHVERAVQKERRRVQSTRTTLRETRATLTSRRQTMERGQTAQEQSNQDLESNRPHLARSWKALEQLREEMAAQRRRICTELAESYPIEPLPKRALAFTIRGLSLPNADFTNVNENEVSAALGHVAHLVHLLALYLSVPLPYPVLPSASTSTIGDPISLMTGSRTFPLYMPRTVLYRFEYGVYLLNKDIELLASKLGLKLIDIRQTLPNLKYVIFVATAGKGELPARKAGGVRGLLISRLEKETPDSSRRSSFENGQAAGQAALRRQLSGEPKIENGSAWKGKVQEPAT